MDGTPESPRFDRQRRLDERTSREAIDGPEPTHCVFGNVEGREFREWVDDLCHDLDRTPVSRLWDDDPVVTAAREPSSRDGSDPVISLQYYPVDVSIP